MTRDDLLRALARRYASGELSDEDYVREEASVRAGPARVRFWAKRRRPRARRDREHVRRLAYSGPLPPQLAARYTPSQLAVLRIVGDAGTCTASVAEIAARAGVSPRTVQATIKLAEGDGLVLRRLRPVRAGRHDTNVVTVVSPEWRAWLARGRRVGAKRCTPLDTRVYEGRQSSGFSSSWISSSGSGGGGGFGLRRAASSGSMLS